MEKHSKRVYITNNMTSKIAIIADIHGNLPAFKTILKDTKNQNIEHIIFPGDMITDCPDSNAIINIIREIMSELKEDILICRHSHK